MWHTHQHEAPMRRDGSDGNGVPFREDASFSLPLLVTWVLRGDRDRRAQFLPRHLLSAFCAHKPVVGLSELAHRSWLEALPGLAQCREPSLVKICAWPQ